MRIKYLFIILGSIIILQNCVSKPPELLESDMPGPSRHTVKTVPIASSYQKSGPDGSITSEKKHVVTLSHYTKIKETEGKALFRIIIENRGDEQIKIDNEKVSVIFEDYRKDRPSRNVKFQSSHELINDLDRNYSLYEIRTLSGSISNLKYFLTDGQNGLIPEVEKCLDILNSMNSEDVTPNNDPTILYEKLLRFTQKALEKKERKLADTLYKIKLKRIELAKLKDVLPDIMLKSSFIMSDSIYSGIVCCDTGFMSPEFGGKFRIVVSIDNEKHEFDFSCRIFNNASMPSIKEW